MKLARKQQGFCGVDGIRNEKGITVSYWDDLESIERWKTNSEHLLARRTG